MTDLRLRIQNRNRAATEASRQYGRLPGVTGGILPILKRAPLPVIVQADTVFQAADQMTTQGSEADEFRAKAAKLREMVDAQNSGGVKTATSRAEIAAGVTVGAQIIGQTPIASGLSSLMTPHGQRQLAISSFIGANFSPIQLLAGPAASTEAVQAVKSEVEANQRKFAKEESHKAEAKTFSEAARVAARVNNLRDLALEMDGRASDKDGAKDGSVTIDSPDRRRWWHNITDEFTFEDSRGKRGGRIEVRADGNKSWTLTPAGDSYTANGETLYVDNGIGYKLDGDGAEILGGKTLGEELQKMGFADSGREHLRGYERGTVVGGMLTHEAKKSGLDSDFNDAVAEVQF